MKTDRIHLDYCMAKKKVIVNFANDIMHQSIFPVEHVTCNYFGNININVKKNFRM